MRPAAGKIRKPVLAPKRVIAAKPKGVRATEVIKSEHAVAAKAKRARPAKAIFVASGREINKFFI